MLRLSRVMANFIGQLSLVTMPIRDRKRHFFLLTHGEHLLNRKRFATLDSCRRLPGQKPSHLRNAGDLYPQLRLGPEILPPLIAGLGRTSPSASPGGRSNAEIASLSRTVRILTDSQYSSRICPHAAAICLYELRKPGDISGCGYTHPTQIARSMIRAMFENLRPMKAHFLVVQGRLAHARCGT